MTLLVTGASGYTGGRLAALARSVGVRVIGTSFSSTRDDLVRLDVRDSAAVDAFFDEHRPSAVVHTAYVHSDWGVTATGAANVAVAAARIGARLVHVSSDAIFAGRPEPYTEDDAPAPVNAYGAAKAAAETAVRAVHPGAVIARTSLIIGDGESHQHRIALDFATGRASGILYTDHVRNPVAVDDLAAALLELVDSDYRGILHVAGPESITRHEMGVLIAARHGIPAHQVPGGSAIERGIISPSEVRLDTSLARRLLRTRLRPVSEILAAECR